MESTTNNITINNIIIMN